MTTMQRVIRESTKRTIEDIRQMADPIFDLPEIERICMRYMQVQIMSANYTELRGSQRLRMPRHLDFSQVAAILNEILDIRTLQPGPGSQDMKRRLALFGPDGSCSQDMSQVKRMALELDNSLTENGLKRVLDRLRLIAPEHGD